MDPSRPVLVAGGSGLIGRALVGELQLLGIPVRLLSRRALSPPGEGVRVHSWTALPDALDHCQAVINLSGEDIARRRWSPGRKALLWESRVEPTSRLVEAMGRLARPPEVLVNASAMGFYGSQGTTPVTETTPQGIGFLADLCGAWEDAALAAQSLGVRVVLLRTGVVLARDGGALPVMSRPIRYGLGMVPGTGMQGVSWIHIQDLVALILFAINCQELSGPLNAVAPGAVSSRFFMTELARYLRRPLWPLPGSAGATLLSLFRGEAARSLILEGAYLQPAKATAHGFRFSYPDITQALQDLLSFHAPPS